MSELPICDFRLEEKCGVCYECQITQLKERNEHLEQFRTDTLATIPKLGEKVTEVQQLREDKKKLIQALNSIAYKEYGRPSEMMSIARKALSEVKE